MIEQNNPNKINASIFLNAPLFLLKPSNNGGAEGEKEQIMGAQDSQGVSVIESRAPIIEPPAPPLSPETPPLLEGEKAFRVNEINSAAPIAPIAPILEGNKSYNYFGGGTQKLPPCPDNEHQPFRPAIEDGPRRLCQACHHRWMAPCVCGASEWNNAENTDTCEGCGHNWFALRVRWAKEKGFLELTDLATDQQALVQAKGAPAWLFDAMNRQKRRRSHIPSAIPEAVKQEGTEGENFMPFEDD